MIDTAAVRAYLVGLQQNLVAALEACDGQPFQRDAWERGTACVIEEGHFFERGGVNFSHVTGEAMPASATAHRPELAGRRWEAMGVSLVLHPRNPYCPTTHMNVRFFVATKEGAEPVWWFGGGMDLTPYYGFVEDAVHFHATCKAALVPFGDEVHPCYKKWCDEYFFLKHRNEPRGIGGIFFDDLNEGGFARCFALMQSVGDHFLSAAMSSSIWSGTAAPCSACSRAGAPSRS